MNASQLFKDWRKAHGLNQTDAGVLFGVSQKAVSKWERGVGTPDPWRLYLAYMYGSYDVAVLARKMLDTLGPKYQLP